MTEAATSPAAIMLRVAEARVEDIARASARVSPHDLERIGARRDASSNTSRRRASLSP